MSRVFILIQIILIPLWSLGAQYGAITSAQGLVEVFIEPQAASTQTSKVIYEGKSYDSVKARVGVKVFPGQIVRTGNGAKAKIIFNNGDQFTIGPASAYVFPGESVAGKQSEVKVLYGKIRAQISPEGSNANIQFKTPVAVAGVRGTELVVSYNPANDKAEVNVLRGKVAIYHASHFDPKTKDLQKGLPTILETGFKTTLDSQAAKEILVIRSTQKDLATIAEETQVKSDPDEIKKLSAETVKDISDLELKAKSNTLADIKKYQPELAKKMQGQSLADIEKTVVAELAKEAPAGAPQKPSLKDFDKKQDEDVYDKYFKKGK